MQTPIVTLHILPHVFTNSITTCASSTKLVLLPQFANAGIRQGSASRLVRRSIKLSVRQPVLTSQNQTFERRDGLETGLVVGCEVMEIKHE
jgi:hypothetical protein